VAVGFPQVTVANPEDSHLSPSNRPARLPRGGDCRVLQRAVDPPHDHLFRPYVPFIGIRGARTNDASSMAGAASFTIYTRTKEFFRDHYLIDHSQLLGCSAVGGIGGAMAGSIISFGSAREFPCNPVVPFSHGGDVGQLSNLSRCPSVHSTAFLLTTDERLQVRRQLEYTIAEKKGIKLVKPPSTATAVRDIFKASGIFGLYTGFYLHFRERPSSLDHPQEAADVAR
jgi:hypothetical protein